MNILIDTQILIWSFDVHSPLSQKHRQLIEDVSNRIFVSQISLMELAIKRNINKLPGFVPDIKTVANQLANNGFELLRLTDEHIFTYQALPIFQEHRDPFDRFLIASAMHEKLTILTSDAKFQLYSNLVNIV